MPSYKLCQTKSLVYILVNRRSDDLDVCGDDKTVKNVIRIMIRIMLNLTILLRDGNV